MILSDRPWIARYDAGVPAVLDFPSIPLFALLEQAAQTSPQQVCTVFQGVELTYQQVNQFADRLAAALVDLGIQKGDRIGIVLPNLPQFVIAYFAVLKAGAVVVAINPRYQRTEMEYPICDSGMKLAITLMDAYPMLKNIQARTSLQILLVTEWDDFAFPEQWAQSETIPIRAAPTLAVGDAWLTDIIHAQPNEARVDQQVTAEDVAVFQYSGGTTGVPKGAVILHRSLVANSWMFRKWLVGLTDGQETSCIAIPMVHVYGMVVGMSVSILLRSKMVLIADTRDLEDLLRQIEQYQVTFFPAVPTLYALINQHPTVQVGRYRLSTIRACICGSAPLPRSVREAFERLTGACLMEGYGLSEAPTATHCNPMFGEKRDGSMGLPLPNVECRIVRIEDGRQTLLPGVVGELVIRSPQVMQGYYQREDETAQALRDGWLFTGDIARMDAEGYFYLIDRQKEMMKVSGFTVWPSEIEAVLALHPAVAEVCVAGIPDPIRGEVPRAWVRLRPGVQVRGEELRRVCADALIYYKVPGEVAFVDALPRSSIGKVLRRELVRRYLEDLA